MLIRYVVPCVSLGTIRMTKIEYFLFFLSLCGGRNMDNPPRSMLIKSLLSDGELVKLVLNGSFPNFCLISY